MFVTQRPTRWESFITATTSPILSQQGLNPYVSSVITGASRVEQVHENMKASEVAPKLTPEVMERIDSIFGVKEEEED